MTTPLDIQNTIIAEARAAGIDPNFALAVAQRESNFNPAAHASKTIHGIFQMTKGLRDKYGIGDSEDPAVQARGFMKYANDEVKAQMKSVLGRDPTNTEMYYGHHFGPVRAAHMISDVDPNTPVQAVFTRQEMEGNPHFAKAGTVGNLLKSIDSDMNKRYGSFGGEVVAGNSETKSAPVAANTTTPTSEPAPVGPMGGLADLGKSIEGLNKSTAKEQALKELMADDTPPFAPMKMPAPTDYNKQLAMAIQTSLQPQQAQQTGGLPALPGLVQPLPAQPQTAPAQPSLVNSLSPLMGQI